MSHNLFYRNKLYCDRSIITDRTVHKNTPDIVILYEPIKEGYLINVAVRKGHNLYSIITEKLQKYTDLKKELTIIW